MPIVKMDEKGRIRVPAEVRESWHLKPRQALVVRVEKERFEVTKMWAPDPKTDPLLRDIMERPLRSKVKVTRELLRRIKDETWAP